MSGDYFIQLEGQRIGRVMKIMGNPTPERWVAFARRRSLSDPENRKGHRTRREAISWLEQQARALNLEYID